MAPSRYARQMLGKPIHAVCAIALLLPLSIVHRAGAQYHTFNEIGAELLAAETNYPAICKRYQLGVSVQNRPIWAVCITNNVGVEEDEPEFRYISSMHGDEILGVEMCLNLVDYLTSNYGVIPRITSLVDSVEIWIVPLMNPDGFVAGTRNNANGINLNRDFPDPYTSPSNTTAGRAAETAVIMNWSFGRSFTLAANFHGGELVANYPYDNNPTGSSVYTASPDDDLFIWISEEYTRHNLPMWNSSSYFHGITNGADWYAISGGMQDWSYRWLGANEITLEISVNKQPPASQIPTFWNDNRESMLAYLETSLIGIRGIVTDARTDEPLWASVRVAGRDHDVYTDPDVGDYHRMLRPGAYDVSFAAEGYDPMTVADVTVSDGDATYVDVALWSTIVSSPDGGEVLAAGTAHIVTWSGSPAAQFQVQHTANADDIVTAADGFESGSLGGEYATGGSASWYATGGTVHAGAFAARSGAITHGQTTWLSRNAQNGNLSFWYRVSSESGYDFFNFYIDGGQVIHASGTAGGWTQYSTTLPDGPHELKWEYTKDGSLSGGSDAAWIDDLQLSLDNTTWTDIVPLTATGATSASWTPVAQSDRCKVRVRSHYADGSMGAWDESNAMFSVSGELIPAVSTWGAGVLGLLLLTLGSFVLRTRAQEQPATTHRGLRCVTSEGGVRT